MCVRAAQASRELLVGQINHLEEQSGKYRESKIDIESLMCDDGCTGMVIICKNDPVPINRNVGPFMEISNLQFVLFSQPAYNTVAYPQADEGEDFV